MTFIGSSAIGLARLIKLRSWFNQFDDNETIKENSCACFACSLSSQQTSCSDAISLSGVDASITFCLPRLQMYPLKYQGLLMTEAADGSAQGYKCS